MRCLLYVLKEAVDREPRSREFVANLEEKLMCEVEVNGGEFVVEFVFWRVLLLKEGSANLKKVFLVDGGWWSWVWMARFSG